MGCLAVLLGPWGNSEEQGRGQEQKQEDIVVAGVEAKHVSRCYVVTKAAAAATVAAVTAGDDAWTGLTIYCDVRMEVAQQRVWAVVQE
jgi:hypothetical protein